MRDTPLSKAGEQGSDKDIPLVCGRGSLPPIPKVDGPTYGVNGSILTEPSALSVSLTGSTSSVIPGLGDMLQFCESSDFDGASDDSQIVQWLDHSGHNNHWNQSETNSAKVDGTTLFNGHKTVRVGFDNNAFDCPAFMNGLGLSAAELMVVFQADEDPPATGKASLITYQKNINILGTTIVAYQPAITDQGCGAGHTFYEDFCLDASAANCGYFCSIGSPTTLTNQPVCYNLSASAAAYKAWLNVEQFHSDALTLDFETGASEYQLGGGFDSNGTSTTFVGVIAAVYLWGRVLTDDERSRMRAYITAKWGISFS